LGGSASVRVMADIVESAVRLAEELLSARVDTVRRLAAASKAEEEAVQVRAAAWAAALRAGWSEAELSRMKFSAPVRRGPGRPRRVKPVPAEEPGGLSAVS
jgi:hypothetical protein